MENITTKGGIPLTNAMCLRIDIYSISFAAAPAVTILGLLQQDNGEVIPLSYSLTGFTNAGAKNSFYIPVTNGTLISLSATATDQTQTGASTFSYGEIYVRASVQLGDVNATAHFTMVELLGDWLSSFGNLNWNWLTGSNIKTNLDTTNLVDSVLSIASPSAGSDFTATLTANTWIRINQVTAFFNADANVATRTIVFGFRLNWITSNIYRAIYPALTTVTASTNRTFNLIHGLNVPSFATTGIANTDMITLGDISGQCTGTAQRSSIISSTNNIQVGDQWGAIAIHAQRAVVPNTSQF